MLSTPRQNSSSPAAAAVSELLAGLVVHKEAHAERVRYTIESRLLEMPRPDMGRGRPSVRIAAVQKAVMSTIASERCYQGLRKDAAFIAFARRMSIVAARMLDWDGKSLRADRQLVESFVDHLKLHYSLLKQHKLSPSVIGIHAHKFTLWEIGSLLAGARTAFGDNPETQRITRTAVALLLMRVYGSVAEARAQYDIKLAESEATFGAVTEMKIIRTTALLLYVKQYRSAQEAKATFDCLLEEATRRCGDDPRNKRMIHAIVFAVYTRAHPTLQAAHAAYLREQRKRPRN